MVPDRFLKAIMTLKESNFEPKAYQSVDFVNLEQVLAPCCKFDLHLVGV
jgi:hypothetical protein